MPHVRIAGIGPDLPLIATVLLAYRRGPTGGTLAGFAIGLAQDLTNPAFLGLNALVKALLGFAAGSGRDALDVSNPPLAAAVLAIAKLVHDLAYLLVFTHLSLSDVFAGLFAAQRSDCGVHRGRRHVGSGAARIRAARGARTCSAGVRTSMRRAMRVSPRSHSPASCCCWRCVCSWCKSCSTVTSPASRCENQLRVKRVIAPRGVIRDHNGKSLVDNVAEYELVVEAGVFRRDAGLLAALARDFGVDTLAARARWEAQRARGRGRGTLPVPVLDHLTKEQLSRFEQNRDRYGGADARSARPPALPLQRLRHSRPRLRRRSLARPGRQVGRGRAPTSSATSTVVPASRPTAKTTCAAKTALVASR